MNLIHKSTVIESVPDRWRRTYQNKDWSWKTVTLKNGKGSEEVYEELITSQPLTEEEVDHIIGNESWTSLKCDECGKEVDLLVVIGQEPNYDSDTARICTDCITKAHELMMWETRSTV